MEEREVLKRLGFKEEKELASIEQLQDYNISYAEDDENYFNLSDKDGKKPEKIIESFLPYQRYILPVLHYAYGRVTITGWRAWLENEVAYFHKGARHDKSWMKKRYETKVLPIDLLMGNFSSDVKDENGLTKQQLQKSYPIDAGHILGKFTKLTPLISDYLGSKQNSDNINIYPQFKNANEQDGKDDHDYGQLHFEREVRDNLPCYYEAEAIIRDWNDVVPIGTRMRMIDTINFKERFHVFIPNIVHEEFSPDSILNKTTAEQYRAFFKGGDLSKLTPKNK